MPWPAVAGVMLAVAALHLLYARISVAVPYVFGDEAKYLTKAAALAGVYTDAWSSAYPGYPLLLAPLFALSHEPEQVFHWTQIVNALLAGIDAGLLLALAGALAPRAPMSRRWIVAVAVACYAPFMAFSDFALSENAFIPLVLLLAWLLCRQMQAPRPWRVAVAAVASAALMLVQPRGIVAAGAFFVAWVLGARDWRARLHAALATAGGVTLFASAKLALDHFLRLRMGYYSDALRGSYPGMHGLVARVEALFSFRALGGVGTALAGQGLYLVSASAGLCGVGAVLLLRGLAGRGPDADTVPAVRAYAWFALLATGLTMLMTALFMHAPGRLDHLFYGRYDEDVIGLLMLPALLWIAPRRTWVGVALAVLALGGIVMDVHGPDLHGWTVRIDIDGWQIVNGFRPLAVNVGGIDLLWVTVCMAALILALGMLARTAVLPWMLVAVFLTAAYLAGWGYLRPQSDLHARQQRIVRYIQRRYPHLACVDYDTAADTFWSLYNYQYFLLPRRLHQTQVSPASHPEPGGAAPVRTRCSPLVISTNRHLDALHPGARLILREYDSDERLWWVPRAGRREQADAGRTRAWRRSTDP